MGGGIDLGTPDVTDITATGATTRTVTIEKTPKYIIHYQVGYGVSGGYEIGYVYDVEKDTCYKIGKPNGASQTSADSTATSTEFISSMSDSSIVFKQVVNVGGTLIYNTLIYY